MSKTKLSKKEIQAARIPALSRGPVKAPALADRTPPSGSMNGESQITNRYAWLHDDPTGGRLSVHNLHMVKFQSGIIGLVDGDQDISGKLEQFISSLPKGSRDEAKKLIDELLAGGLPLKLVLNAVIIKADNAREVGLNLLEWQKTLPGGKLTRDLYEQHRAELVDGHGQSVRFELLEWFMQMARDEKSEINTFLAAIRHKQLLLAASGDGSFALEAERAPQAQVEKPDERIELMKLFQPSLLQTRWAALKANPNYYRDGKIVPSMRHIVERDWSEYFAVTDEIRAALKA